MRVLRLALPILVSLGAVTAATTVLRGLGAASPTTVALSYLLIVLFVAAWTTLPVAVATAVAAMLALNFFFMPPIGTFTIADPHNWVALGAFLVVAVVASQLSNTARARETEAVERRNEVTRLFDVSRDVLLTTDRDDAAVGIARHVARRFELPISDGRRARRGRRLAPGAREGSTRWRSRPPISIARGPRPAALSNSMRGRGAMVGTARSSRRAGPWRSCRCGLACGGSGSWRSAGDRFIRAPRTRSQESSRLPSSGHASWPSGKPRCSRGNGRTSRRALLAALGHDLRTPLTAIRVAVTNAADTHLDGDLRAGQAVLAVKEIDHLARLLQEILDMARIEANAVRADPQWVTAGAVVEAAQAHAGTALARHRLVIDADEATEVQIDPRLTSAALAHLLENAAKYSPPGTAIHVARDHRRRGAAGHRDRRRARPEGARTSIASLSHSCAAASGPSHRRHRVGSRHQPRAARRREGAGLGRATRTGTGARFTIAVPATEPSGRAGAGLSMTRILVVDDEPSILAALVPLLRGRAV